MSSNYGLGERIGRITEYNRFENTMATTVTYIGNIRKVEAASNKTTIACPKGYAAFPELSLPECVTSDVMHTIYGGPLRDDLLVLFKNKELFQLFDSAIANTKWPIELSGRKLRSLSESNLYKASEWKSIILYVSVPVLCEFTKKVYLPSEAKLFKQCENILLGISAILLLMKDVS